MKKTVIPTPHAPPAKGPYSSAVACGDLLFLAGQGPVDPRSGQVVRGTLEEQMHLTFTNVRNILADAGSSLDKVVKITLYLKDIGSFARANEVYRGYFTSDYPARTCVQAGALPFDIEVEIDVIACRS